MRLFSVLTILFGTVGLAASTGGHGPEIWGSYNEIDDCEMKQAIECLEEQICARRNIPYHGKIRCTIGTSVAYICNYKDKRDQLPEELRYGNETGGELNCDTSDLYEAWRQIRIAKGSQTGWWYDMLGKRTMGFDRRCKDNECDNGWSKGSEGEACTNIHKDAPKEPWIFDYEAQTYKDYTGKFEEDLPDCGDDTIPVYFNPWYEGKRPRKPYTFRQLMEDMWAKPLRDLWKPGPDAKKKPGYWSGR